MTRRDRRGEPGARREQRIAALHLNNYLSLVSQVLEIADRLERWGNRATDDEARRVERLRKQVLTGLVQHGIMPNAAIGEAIDLARHEVVGVDHEATAAAPDTIVEIIETGYDISTPEYGWRTLRPAKVISAPRAPGSHNASQDEMVRG